MTPDRLKDWISAVLLAAVCGFVGTGVSKLDDLTDSVVELNKSMAVLAFTVNENRAELESHGKKIDMLDWLRDSRLKDKILYDKD